MEVKINISDKSIVKEINEAVNCFLESSKGQAMLTKSINQIVETKLSDTRVLNVLQERASKVITLTVVDRALSEKVLENGLDKVVKNVKFVITDSKHFKEQIKKEILKTIKIG